MISRDGLKVFSGTTLNKEHLRIFVDIFLKPRGPKTMWTGWWFGTFLFFHILGIIIPIDVHIFQRV